MTDDRSITIITSPNQRALWDLMRPEARVRLSDTFRRALVLEAARDWREQHDAAEQLRIALAADTGVPMTVHTAVVPMHETNPDELIAPAEPVPPIGEDDPVAAAQDEPAPAAEVDPPTNETSAPAPDEAPEHPELEDQPKPSTPEPEDPPAAIAGFMQGVDAPPTHEPEPAARSAASGEQNRARVLAAYREADGWMKQTAIAAALGLSENAMRHAVMTLAEGGLLEHNGKGGHGRRYRATSRPGPATRPEPKAPALSGRERRAQAAVARTTREPGQAEGEQNGTLAGRILMRCAHKPSTIPELQAQFSDDDEAAVARAVIELEAEGDLHRAGRAGRWLKYEGRV